MIYYTKILSLATLIALGISTSVSAQVSQAIYNDYTTQSKKSARLLLPCESGSAATPCCQKENQKAQYMPQRVQYFPQKLNCTEKEKSEKNPIIQAVYSALEGNANPIELVSDLYWDAIPQITIECRFLTVAPESIAPKGFTQENGWQFVAKPDKNSDSPLRCNDWLESRPQTIGSVQISETYTPTLYRFIDEIEIPALYEHCFNDVDSNLLQAPKITMFNEQMGSIVDVSERSYFIGITNEGNPEFQLLGEGIQLTLSPKLLDDDSIQLQRCSFSLKKVEKVENFPLIPGEDESGEKTLQIPKITTFCVEMPITVPKGQSVLLAVPGTVTEVEKPLQESDMKTLYRGVLAHFGLRPLKEAAPQRKKLMNYVIITPRVVETEPQETPQRIQYTSPNLREVQKEWEELWLRDYHISGGII